MESSGTGVTTMTGTEAGRALRSRRTRRALPHRHQRTAAGLEGRDRGSVVSCAGRRGPRARPARCKGAGNADRHHRRAPGARGHGSRRAHVARRTRGEPRAARGRDRAAALLLEGDGGAGLAGHPPARGARWRRCGVERAGRRARRARSPGGTGAVPADGAGLGGDRAVRQRRAARPLPARAGRREQWSPRSASAARSACRAACSTATAGSSSVGRRRTCCCCAPATTVVVVRRDADGVSLGGTKNLDPSRRSAAVTVSSRGASATPTCWWARRGAPALWPARSARRRPSASWPPARTRPWPTPRSGCSSAGRSGPSRLSSTTAPTCWWRRSWPRRPCGMPPGPRATRPRSSTWPPPWRRS